MMSVMNLTESNEVGEISYTQIYMRDTYKKR